MKDNKDNDYPSNKEEDDLELKKKKFENDFKKILKLRKEISVPADILGVSSCIGQFQYWR